MTCALCGNEVKQVASATPELAMFQHMLWIHGFIELIHPHDDDESRPGEPLTSRRNTKQAKNTECNGGCWRVSRHASFGAS